MTKNRSSKQAAHALAQDEGISFTAASRLLHKGADDEQETAGRPSMPNIYVPQPDFKLTTHQFGDGDNFGGPGIEFWNIKMFTDSESEHAYADERGVEWDYNSFSEDKPIGAAEAVVHPDARLNGDFMINMDDSDEELTLIGEYLGEPHDPQRSDDESYRYTGAPARRLFATARRPDALIVGAFNIKPGFQGRDYPNVLVDALLRSIGRRAGFVAVEPDKKAHGENGVDYWRSHGFHRFNKTPVFVRKVLPVKARAEDEWEGFGFDEDD